MTTLKDIRDYMIDSMGHYNPKDNGEYYDEDGHCGDGLWVDIQDFWKGFSTDDDFKYLVSGEWFGDELDLEGGRSYLLDSEMCKMCFDYMYNTLGWSASDYDKVIWNSCGFSDDLQYEYDNISIKRDEKLSSIISEPESEIKEEVTKLKCITTEFNHHASDIIKVGEVYDIVDKTREWHDNYKMIYIDIGGGERAELAKICFEPYEGEKKTNIWDTINFQGDFDYIPHVIKYHKSRKDELDTYDSIEYLDKSKVDDNFICYKIKSLGVKIPKGYEIIEPIEEIMKR